MKANIGLLFTLGKIAYCSNLSYDYFLHNDFWKVHLCKELIYESIIIMIIVSQSVEKLNDCNVGL